MQLLQKKELFYSFGVAYVLVYIYRLTISDNSIIDSFYQIIYFIKVFVV